MAKVAKPAKGASGNTVGSAIVADFILPDFDPAEDGSAQTITAKPGTIGTATYNALVAAREGLLRAGQTPPAGLTLRSAKGDDAKDNADGTVTVTVTYFYGDPTENTEAKYIGVNGDNGPEAGDGEAQ